MMGVFPFLRSFTSLYYINNARFKNVKVPIKKFSKKFLYHTKESLLLCTAAGFCIKNQKFWVLLRLIFIDPVFFLQIFSLFFTDGIIGIRIP